MTEFRDMHNMTTAKFIYVIHNTHSFLRTNHTQGGVTMLLVVGKILERGPIPRSRPLPHHHRHHRRHRHHHL
jgi:hypothetical protein